LNTITNNNDDSYDSTFPSSIKLQTPPPSGADIIRDLQAEPAGSSSIGLAVAAGPAVPAAAGGTEEAAARHYEQQLLQSQGQARGDIEVAAVAKKADPLFRSSATSSATSSAAAAAAANKAATVSYVDSVGTQPFGSAACSAEQLEAGQLTSVHDSATAVADDHSHSDQQRGLLPGCGMCCVS
jgi:hypothetical protein